jgi:hypothetical protein
VTCLRQGCCWELWGEVVTPVTKKGGRRKSQGREKEKKSFAQLPAADAQYVVSRRVSGVYQSFSPPFLGSCFSTTPAEQVKVLCQGALFIHKVPSIPKITSTQTKWWRTNSKEANTYKKDLLHIPEGKCAALK